MCIGCHHEKSIDQFWKNTAYADGLDAKCNICKRNEEKAKHKAIKTNEGTVPKRYPIRNKRMYVPLFEMSIMCPICNSDVRITHTLGDGLKRGNRYGIRLWVATNA